MRVLFAALFALALPAAGLGAPSISGGTVSPTDWSASQTAIVGWVQTEFTGANLGPARVEVNLADDGSDSGAWAERATIAAPLVDGSNGVVNLPVGNLEGEHRVRVVITGAIGSPLTLGTVELDRSGPAISGVTLSANAAQPQGRAAFTIDDALSGFAPGAAVLVEYQSGVSWLAAVEQPTTGPGTKSARLSATGLAEGDYAVRVTATDVIGNTAVRDLGTLRVDRTAPTLTGVQVVRAPTPEESTMELAFSGADPAGGTGLPAANAFRVIETGSGAVLGTADAGATRITAQFALPGRYVVAVTATDVAGNVTTSIPFEVIVPVLGSGRNPALQPITPLTLRTSGPPRLGPRWVLSATRRLHARRGVTVNARLATARTPAQWSTMLGTPDAARFDAYTTFGGVVAIGPAATRALDSLRDQHRCVRNCRRISRADADRAVSALAVVLHESLHASGPLAIDDYRNTASGRAFEEGFAEAATIDLLPDLVAELKPAPRVRRMIRPAIARYRSQYPEQMEWAGSFSRALNPTPAAARAWRLHVADTWGIDRWTRLASATGRTENNLRASIPPLVALPGR